MPPRTPHARPSDCHPHAIPLVAIRPHHLIPSAARGLRPQRAPRTTGARASGAAMRPPHGTV
eukprot:scaffold264147_cov30-Tisochrysis_lutea.AAC.5